MKLVRGSIEGSQPLGPGLLIHLRWSYAESTCTPGQFFLVRCTPNADTWDPYLRRALFPAVIASDHLALWLTDDRDRGIAWLTAQPRGTPLDLLGPGGHGFTLPPSPGNVLILAQDDGLGVVWPMLTQALAAGNQVTLALGTQRGDLAVSPTVIPIAAEYRLATADGSAGIHGDALALLDDLEGWPDRIYAAIPPADWPRLRAWIERWRPRIEAGFAQVFVPTPILCGTGACLACVVTRANGRFTRACVHGPIMDLTALA